MRRIGSKSKAILASLALVLVFLSCQKESEVPNDDPNVNGGNTENTEATFELSVTATTEESISYTVVPSVNTVYYYVTALAKATYGEADAQTLVTAVTDKVASEADAAGASLEDYLAQVLQLGESSGTVDGLSDGTEYLLVVLGLSPTDGSATTQPTTVETATVEDPTKLKFVLEYSNLTSTSVDLRVTPSDLDADYIFLTQAASAYPDLDENDPNAIAERYIATYGSMYNAGIGLIYNDVWEITGFSLVKNTKYYFFAFGYTRGVGITSDCYLVTFTSLTGTSPEEFEANISVTGVGSTAFYFTVTPSDGHEDTYYGVVSMPTSEYSEQTAKSEIEEAIQYEYDMQHSMGFTSFSVVDAVENICYVGTQSLTASSLASKTEYTIAVVAVDNEGKAAKVITNTVTTN